MFGVEGIDDLAADIAGDPDFVNLHLFFRVDAQFDYFSKITSMGKLEGDAHGGVFGQGALAPAGFIGDELEDTLHTGGVEVGREGVGLGVRVGDAREAEKIEAELDGIFSGRVSELVGERLEDPGEGVAARGAQSVGGNAERHERSAEGKIREESAGEFVAGNVGGGSELLAFAETDEVIAPGDEIAGGVEAALQIMKAGGAIVIVVEIVLAGPEEFHGDANLFGNGGRFEHVIVSKAAAEATTCALQVNDDVARGNVQELGDLLAAGFRSLAGRPEFEFAVVIVREAILGLHGGVGEEGVGVSGFDGFCGGLQGGVGVAVLSNGDRGSLFGELIGTIGEAFAALLCGGAFVPLGAQFFSGGVGLPPGVGDDGDSAVKAEQVGGTIHGEGMADAGLGFDFVKIGAEEFAGVDGALFVDGVQHSGNFEVDAVERFSGDDGGVVDAVSGLADDFVIFGILELDGFEIGRGQGGGFFGERAVSERAVCGLMNDAAGRGLALGFRNRPGLCGGGNEHLTASGADTAERVPVDRCGGAAAGALGAVFCFIEIGLLDANGFPIDVQFIGDDHGETGFHALTDFGILSHDGDGTVGGDANKSRGKKRWGSCLRGLGEELRDLIGVEGEEDAAARDSGNAKEGATIEERGNHKASVESGFAGRRWANPHRGHCNARTGFVKRHASLNLIRTDSGRGNYFGNGPAMMGPGRRGSHSSLQWAHCTFQGLA